MSTIEELEASLNFPSFEEELARSSVVRTIDRDMKLKSCPNCGCQTFVGPGERFKCPAGPHDIEDDNRY